MGLFDFFKKEAKKKCYVFGCYDHDRVVAMSLFQPGFYVFINVIKMVRNWQNVPSSVEIEYYEPKDWNAPDIVATSNSFDCNIDALYRQAELFLAKKEKINSEKLSLFSKTNIPYPDQGLLLLVYKPS